ncbi:helix-turn-helix protein [Dysgonomonas alginatilytica]|uniref:Helix-turn-helix protein n=1 Tax=Dysgonomonas alginatilytica TaxID=1605892 RepID=A0A2V3PHW1_9BACT|nr:helix-turn-helix transcriptional regulator [Dysgonomonas alginatilytica]PXV58856.1 helix-turn-helix protein [Dysgonomonas alginatilytica]
MEAAVKKSNHGANVRRWREWRNINQDVLAEQIGVSQATLSGYEKKDKIEQEILERIAKALDIPVEAITELEQGTAINIFSGTFTDFKDNAAILNSYPTFNPIDKVVELYEEKTALYERMLKEKEETILLLHEVLKERK